jgi:predicted choloylglycine hydrolase
MFVVFRNTARLLLAICVFAAPAARADDTRPFREGRSGNGELRYINDLPVLSVAGTAEEIGRQKAVLTRDVVKKLADYPRLLLEKANHKERLPKYLETGKIMIERLPDDYRDEMRSFARHSGINPDMGILANTLADIYRGMFSCSSLMVDAKRSATKGPLFGRNLDFYTLGLLDKYSLVTVHQPKGKHAFVSIGFPGLFGCLSGMNDRGLALAVHEVFLSRDGAPMFNRRGMPYTFCFRQILEKCATVEEAEELLRATARTTLFSLAVCDRRHSVVLEATPFNVVARHGSEGICACTNHFRSPDLMVLPWCNRYRKLIQSRKREKLDIADVAQKLNEVAMGRMTVQTMIFEPVSLKLHLAIGSCPSSALPLKPLELGPLFSR